MLNYNTHPFVFHIDKPALEVSADVFSTLPIESTCTFVRARRARVGEDQQVFSRQLLKVCGHLKADPI